MIPQVPALSEAAPALGSEKYRTPSLLETAGAVLRGPGFLFERADMTETRGAGDITPEDLNKIVEAVKSAKGDMDEARSELGNLFKNAENDNGVHRAALKLAIKLQGQATEKRADFLRAFDSYRHIMRLDDQPDLLDDAA